MEKEKEQEQAVINTILNKDINYNDLDIEAFYNINDMNIKAASNTYNCYCFYKRKESKRVLKCHTACWAGIRVGWRNEKTVEQEYLYIYNFIDNTSLDLKFIRGIIYLINEITPCELVFENNKLCIKYKLIHLDKDKTTTFNTNLILLNFIRMLWYSSVTNGITYKDAKLIRLFSHVTFKMSVRSYRNKVIKLGEDPLYFLMDCIKKSIPKNLLKTELGQIIGYGYNNHSIVDNYIIPKKAKELLDLKQLDSTQIFLRAEPKIKKEIKKTDRKVVEDVPF